MGTDAMLEFPHSGERLEGVENFQEWRSNYPANTAFEFREVRGRDALWVAELSVSYDQDLPKSVVSILEFRGDRIARESICITGAESHLSGGLGGWRCPKRSTPGYGARLRATLSGVLVGRRPLGDPGGWVGLGGSGIWGFGDSGTATRATSTTVKVLQLFLLLALFHGVLQLAQ
jgi:hypothetical protein